MPEIKFELSEILALYLIKSEARIFRGTEIEKKINTVFSKLSSFVPEDVVSKLHRIRTIFLASNKFSKDYSGKEEIIDSLTEAMISHITCYVKYHAYGRNKKSNFAIDPLYLFENKGGLYVFVRMSSFGNIRVLAIERVLTLTHSEKKFEYPDDFDPEERLNSAFDLIADDPLFLKIWFSKDQARYVKERRIVNDYKILDQEDGSIILEMNTSGRDDVKRWVLSYGSDAEVTVSEAKELINGIENPEQFLESIKFGIQEAVSNYLSKLI